MIDVRRAGDRFVTEAEGRTTWHSFSFGAHYDPANLGFASLTALNDELLPDGTGYPDHRHRDVEIVTWVLEGALRHTDDAGNDGVLLPGTVQRTSAGSGIVHAEVTEPRVRTRFLQAWLRPDEPGGPPAHAATGSAPADGLAEVVGPGALDVRVRGARLLAGTVTGRVVLPDAPLLHVFVVDGTAVIGDRELAAGDAARLVDEGGRALSADGHATVGVWAFAD